MTPQQDDLGWLDSFADEHNATATLPMDDPQRAAPIPASPEVAEATSWLDSFAAQEAGLTLGDLGITQLPPDEAMAQLEMAAQPVTASLPGAEDIPFVGYGFTLANQAQALQAQARVLKGKGTVEDERLYLSYLVDQSRSKTYGAGLMETLYGIATTGLEIAGGGVAVAGAKKGAKVAARKLFSEALESAAQTATERKLAQVALETGAALGVATVGQEVIPSIQQGEGLTGGGAWTLQSVQTLFGREMTDEEAQEIIDAKNALIPVLLEQGGGLVDGMIRQSISMGVEATGGVLGKLPIVSQLDAVTGALFLKLSGKVKPGGWSKAVMQIAQQQGIASEVAEEFLDAGLQAAVMGDKPIIDAIGEVVAQTPELVGALALLRGGMAGASRGKLALQGRMEPTAPEALTGAGATEGGDPTQAAPDAQVEGVAASVEAPSEPVLDLTPEERVLDVDRFRRSLTEQTGAEAPAMSVVEPESAAERRTQAFLRRYGVEPTFVALDDPEAALDADAFYPGPGRAVVVRGRASTEGAAVHEALHTWESQQAPAKRAEFTATMRALDPRFVDEVAAFVRSQPVYQGASEGVIEEEIRANMGSFLGGVAMYLDTPKGRADFALAYEQQPGPIRKALGALYDWIADRIRALPQRRRALARARLRIARNSAVSETDAGRLAQVVLDAMREIRPTVRAEAPQAPTPEVGGVPTQEVGGAMPQGEAPVTAGNQWSPDPGMTPRQRRRAARRQRVEATQAERDAAAFGLGPDQGMRFAPSLPPTLTINGVERPTTNGDGRPLASDEDGVRAFWRWFGESKVVDVQGRPKVVYHSGTFSESEHGIPRTGAEGMHFGTEDAARERLLAKPKDDFVRTLQVEQDESPDGERRWYWRSPVEGLDSFDVVGEEGYATEAEARADANRFAPDAETVAESLRGEDPDLTTAYLRIVRPLGSADMGADWTTAVREARADGYDGLVYSNRFEDVGSISYVVLDPTQVKSATGNAGTFDPANPDIRFAPKIPSSALRQSFLDDGEIVTWPSKTGRALSDEFLAVARWQKGVEALASERVSANPTSAIRRFFGKIADRAEKVKKRRERVERILRVSKIDLADAGRYMEAVHTREARDSFLAQWRERLKLQEQRRAILRSIKDLPRDSEVEAGLRALEKRIAETDHLVEKARMADGDTLEHHFHEVAELTGFKTSEAEAFVAERASNPGYEKVRAEVRELRRETVDAMRRDQLITEDQRAAWLNQFQDYVPLRTAEVDMPEGPRSSGFQIRGPETKRRKGRRSEASNPLVMSFIQAQKAIERGEKNKVGHEVRDFVRAHAEWVDAKETTGDVERDEKGAPKLPADAFYLKVDGRDTVIALENPDLARALKRIALPQIPKALRMYASLMGTWKALTTAWNPQFLVTNFERDIQTALINVSDVAQKYDLTGLRRALVSNMGRAMRTNWQVSREKPVTTGLEALHTEWREAGGKIGSFGSASFEDLSQSMDAGISTGTRARIKRGVQPIIDFVGDANGAVENATRFSLYVALRERGVPANDAALASRQLTVDFSQKGEWGTALSMGYAFFSASVGGTRRLYEALRDSKVARGIAGGIIGMGFTQALLMDALSDEDEDGQKLYAKIPDFDKEKYAILMLPGWRDPFKLIMPWGYNVFHNLGRIAGEQVLGYRTPKESAVALGVAALNAFSPIGTAPSAWQLVAPTALDPLVQIQENMNFAGAPIAPQESPFGVEQPRYQRHYRTTGASYTAIAKMLNDITGGDSVKPGAINWSGDHVEHLAEFIGSGAMRFTNDLRKTITGAFQGESFWDIAETAPFLKTMYGARTEFTDSDNFYDALDAIEYQKRYVKEAEEAGDRERARELRERYRATLALGSRGERVKKQARALVDEAYAAGGVPVREKLEAANRLQQRWYRDWLLALSASGDTP